MSGTCVNKVEKGRPLGPVAVKDARIIATVHESVADFAATGRSLIGMPRSPGSIRHSEKPPSTMWIAPVVKLLSSDARYTAKAAISAGLPRRPTGCRLTKRLPDLGDRFAFTARQLLNTDLKRR